MKKYSHYSVEEDTVITECIKNNMGCISEGCEEAHTLLPYRTTKAIQQRWYSFLKYKEKNFELKNDNQSLVNIKNIKLKKTTPFILTPEEIDYLKLLRSAKEYGFTLSYFEKDATQKIRAKVVEKLEKMKINVDLYQSRIDSLDNLITKLN